MNKLDPRNGPCEPTCMSLRFSESRERNGMEAEATAANNNTTFLPNRPGFPTADAGAAGKGGGEDLRGDGLREHGLPGLGLTGDRVDEAGVEQGDAVVPDHVSGPGRGDGPVEVSGQVQGRP